MNLTDEQIINGFKYCYLDYQECDACPLDEVGLERCDEKQMANLILDMVNRLRDEKKSLIDCQKTLQKTIVEQKTEIESLQKANKDLVNCLTHMETLYKIKCKEVDSAKTKAIKEVVKRFVQIARKTTINYVADKTIRKKETGWYEISISDFDNLVKELTERKDKT